MCSDRVLNEGCGVLCVLGSSIWSILSTMHFGLSYLISESIPSTHWGAPWKTVEAAEAVVTRVLSQVSYSQRCIEDRRINPHGEEAEDVFEIEEALTQGCGPAIRY